MIIPTQRAVVLAVATAPVALLLGVFVPEGWLIGIGIALAIPILVLIDGLTAPRIPADAITVTAPKFVEVGDPVILTPGSPQFDYRAQVSAPLQPGADPLVFATPRRGTAQVSHIWARARGALGLAWRQKNTPGSLRIGILPNLRSVREQGVRQYLNSQHRGARLRVDSGDGTEFHSLTDFQSGMERRAIDWKASARNRTLLAREFRSERSNSVVFAMDCGRTMSDPLDGVPRIDRAISAALLSAFVALKSGDTVRLFGFSNRPVADSGSVEGARGFARLQESAASFDYGAQESNFTLSLVTLDQRLSRRSLIILFTEFTDPTSAELMLASAARLRKRHRLMMVLFRDIELERLLDARPQSAQDVARANVAHILLRERRIVIERLRRLGVQVLEAHFDDLSLALADHYIRDRDRP